MVVAVAAIAISLLAADGDRIAYVAGCEVRLVRPAIRLAKPSCPRTSTGSGIAAVSLAGRRVLWLHYTGGNIREWSLWTRTPSSRPRRIAFILWDVDAPPPIVLGEGDASRFGDLLPYAIGHEVVVLRSSGARRFAWTAPARVTALAAKAGELAVGLEDGRVFVLDAAGRELRTESFGARIDAVRITGNAVAVQTGRSLRVREQVFALPRGAALVDAEGSRAVLAGGGKVRLLDLGSGQSRVVAGGAAAQLEGVRLVYASGRRVVATTARR
jgi:hypothetical protein